VTPSTIVVKVAVVLPAYLLRPLESIEEYGEFCVVQSFHAEAAEGKVSNALHGSSEPKELDALAMNVSELITEVSVVIPAEGYLVPETDTKYPAFGTQLAAPTPAPVFAGQAVHTPAALYVLAGHGRQAVVLPKPYVPEGQVWQEVEVPSMKNWPAVQHTAWPEGVQRTVPEGHEIVVGHCMNGESTLPLLYMDAILKADSTVL
jgi:hypothetical protein